MKSAVRDELLRRSFWPTAIATVSGAHWLFGNLYEEVVTMPPALRRPQPGALVGPLALGSPAWYYGPSLPLTLGGLWLTAHRLRGHPELLRPVRRGGYAIAAAALLKATLITVVNPTFRDPTLPVARLRRNAAVWLVGNGLGVAALAYGLVAFTAWRRLPRYGSAPGRRRDR